MDRGTGCWWWCSPGSRSPQDKQSCCTAPQGRWCCHRNTQPGTPCTLLGQTHPGRTLMHIALGSHFPRGSGGPGCSSDPQWWESLDPRGSSSQESMVHLGERWRCHRSTAQLCRWHSRLGHHYLCRWGSSQRGRAGVRGCLVDNTTLEGRCHLQSTKARNLSTKITSKQAI